MGEVFNFAYGGGGGVSNVARKMENEKLKYLLLKDLHLKDFWCK